MLTLGGNAVGADDRVRMEPPAHPYLSGMHSFCGACPRFPAEARCEGCPITAAETAQLQDYRDAQPAGAPCPVCGSVKSKRRRRAQKENA